MDSFIPFLYTAGEYIPATSQPLLRAASINNLQKVVFPRPCHPVITQHSVSIALAFPFYEDRMD
jgi:hypothetical protein